MCTYEIIYLYFFIFVFLPVWTRKRLGASQNGFEHSPGSAGDMKGSDGPLQSSTNCVGLWNSRL